ncbi:Hypothetical predicted protein [Octopus vulgaris]|uniref:Uncharacterized protein n=1 Tax=Octopus vulgaris TaxID=6645 RepID=A0AA36BR35_OCTVU|nr:Hypothetical predicted protein [Octopus vulgaris]
MTSILNYVQVLVFTLGLECQRYFRDYTSRIDVPAICVPTICSDWKTSVRMRLVCKKGGIFGENDMFPKRERCGARAD